MQRKITAIVSILLYALWRKRVCSLSSSNTSILYLSSNISEPNNIYTSEVFCSHERNQIAFIYKMFAYLLLYTIALYAQQY